MPPPSPGPPPAPHPVASSKRQSAGGWTENEITRLRAMKQEGKSTAEMIKALGRTKSAIWSQVHLLKKEGKLRA